MARMIPATFSPDIKSAAEKRIFGWFQNLNWQDCVILHSLEMAQHVDNIFGEIDFVIIADEGILCVEVKGGVVKRENGNWSFINRYGARNTKKVGPYNQAQGNMQSLRQYLVDRLGYEDPIARCQYACCVMAPDCQIVVDGDPDKRVKGRLDFIPEITFSLGMIQADLPLYLSACFKYWKDDMVSHNRRPGGRLSKDDKERLVELLRGDFALVPAMSLVLNRTEEMLLSLTDEQYVIMQNFFVNKRMLIYGPAGTGKTLLAMEQCRRLRAEGKKVLYVCYNRLIANSVREKFNEENKSDIDVYTLPALLMKLCNISSVNEDKQFFDQILPEKFMEASEEYLPLEKRYDVLIVDEGQDLMNTYSILCLNELVKGGLDKGRWAMYFDKNQNIFGQYEELQEIFEDLEDKATCYPLSVNCRNTKQIAVGNWYNTNISQAPIMKADGEEIRYHKFVDKNAERKELFKEIRRLRAEGIGKSDIVILSPIRYDNENSCLCGVKIPDDIGTICFDNHYFRNENVINAYTVQAYKGLESKVVLYIDIDSFEDEDARLRNYVAMSRARTYLELFYPEDLEMSRQKMMLSGLLNGNN